MSEATARDTDQRNRELTETLNRLVEEGALQREALAVLHHNQHSQIVQWLINHKAHWALGGEDAAGLRRRVVLVALGLWAEEERSLRAALRTERAEAALRWYAEEENWRAEPEGDRLAPADHDVGMRAREVLAKEAERV